MNSTQEIQQQKYNWIILKSSTNFIQKWIIAHKAKRLPFQQPLENYHSGNKLLYHMCIMLVPMRQHKYLSLQRVSLFRRTITRAIAIETTAI